MRWYPALLVVAASLLASSDALSSAADLAEVSSTAAVASIVTETTARQFLRADKTDAEAKDGDADVDSEDRVVPESLKSLNTFKSIKKTFSRAGRTFSEHVSPVLPLKARLQVWAKNEKSVEFVRQELMLSTLDDLTEAARKKTTKFKFYDDFVTSQLPVWTKKQLTPTEVKEELGLLNLADNVLERHPNFKYYDEYLNSQALVWVKDEVTLNDALMRLGLNTLAEAERTKALNFKYYEEFVANQIRVWLRDDASVMEVMGKFHLNGLSAEAVLAHPNYGDYKYFVKRKLKEWAEDWTSYDDVSKRLGLEGLAGRTLEMHPNFLFFNKYKKKGEEYLLHGWLKQRRTTFDIWQMLKLFDYRDIKLRTSKPYKVYEKYVNLLDDYILKLTMENAEIPPNLVSKEASVRELQIKTQIWTKNLRPEDYVKNQLGLKNLEGDELKAAPNYEFYDYYLKGRVHIKKE
uniref:Avh41 n=1 Tax=Phytophthora sojae TaxID=67593 RepID=G1FR11_PHYSO|nr:Avh41 [Phytophthora sojae]